MLREYTYESENYTFLVSEKEHEHQTGAEKGGFLYKDAKTIPEALEKEYEDIRRRSGYEPGKIPGSWQGFILKIKVKNRDMPKETGPYKVQWNGRTPEETEKNINAAAHRAMARHFR